MIRALPSRPLAPRLRGPLLGLAACALSLLATRDATAQSIPETNSDGFDTHLFRPAMDSKGFFHTNGTDILGKNDYSFGLVIDYGRELLRVRGLGQDSPQLINHSFQGTASFNYGLANLLVLGLSMPVNLMAGDQQVDKQVPPQPTMPANQWNTNQLDSQTIGFLGLHGKMRLLRVERGFGLALSAQVGLPVTDAPRNAGADPKFFYWPQVIAEKRFGSIGQFKIGANVGFRGHVVSDTTLDLREGRFKDGNRVTYGLGMSYRVLEPVDLVADTYATYLLSGEAAGKIKPSNEVVGGLKIFVERNSYLMIGAGSRYTDGFETANVRGFIGFIFEPSIGDRDGDGIKDDVDQCPDEPEDFDGFKDEDGCPDPDNDGDGVLDEEDACPLLKGEARSDPKLNGCPSPDRDGDTFDDASDKCPDAAEDFDGVEDDDGCPDDDADKPAALRAKPLLVIEEKGDQRTLRWRVAPKLTGKAEAVQIDPKTMPSVRALATELNKNRAWVALVGVRPAGGTQEAEQEALNKSFALVNTLRALTHRDDAAESIGWSAVKAQPGAAAQGYGILILGSGAPGAAKPATAPAPKLAIPAKAVAPAAKPTAPKPTTPAAPAKAPPPPAPKKAP